MSLNYTAIDFETANSFRGSPCSVGLVKVRDGVEVDSRHWLMKPPEAYDWFDPFNTWLHGISADTVRFSPRWRDRLPEIIDFVGGDVLVAHNAGFDIGVMRYACAADNIEWPAVDFLCTLVVARRAFRLPSYRLPFVVDACGGVLTDHHDANADARAVVDIITALSRREEVASIHDLAARFRIRVGHMESGIYLGSVHRVSATGALIRPDANPDADPEHPLYGRVCVFTGALMTMTRQIAWENVVRVGGIPDRTPTKRTNVLVVGDINPAVLRPGSNLTGKARRAFELQDAGQDIELMTEDDFLRIL